MAKDCRAKPTAAFPWSTEDLVRAWQLTYDNTETPERQTLCEKMSTDAALYKNLLSKVKRRVDAEREFRAQREATKAEKVAEAEKKQAEKAAKQAEREQKRLAKEQRPSALAVESTTALNPFQEPDLLPFPAEILARASAEVPQDSPQFWSHLYRTYADFMVPRLARM